MGESVTGTVDDVRPVLEEARALVNGREGAEDFTINLVRLIGQQKYLLPGETWTYINEMFYAAEEHVADPAYREETGGLDDRGLVGVVASQLPALEDEMRRLETGAPPPRGGDPAGRELLCLARALVDGSMPADAFAPAYTARLDERREQLGTRALAAAESIQSSVDQLVPDGARRRMYEIDATVLRARVEDIEPRLAAAVEAR